MNEREAIVAWIINEAEELESYGLDHCDEIVRLDMVARAIARGVHLNKDKDDG